MRKIRVAKDQRGLMYRKGDYEKLLSPGKHRFFPFQDIYIELYSLDEPFLPPKHLSLYLKDEKLNAELHVIDVKDNEIALHLEDGHLVSVLEPGQHAFWKAVIRHDFVTVALDKPAVDNSVDKSLLKSDLLKEYLNIIDVEPFEQALLYIDSIYQKVLPPGRYYFWKTGAKVVVQRADMRRLQLDMTGQESMTADKVTLRLNFICHYRIVDPVKALSQIKSYEEQLYILMQLILREYIGTLNLDDLLGKKEEIGDFTLERLKDKGSEWGLEFIFAGVKDIILPGEIKAILNQVIEAEKKAQANIIMRREETASTRSLLNTAKLMETNPTLVKLKEMEYIEKISERISHLSVVGGGSFMEQFLQMFQSQTKSVG